jgi:hypothetical protein
MKLSKGDITTYAALVATAILEAFDSFRKDAAMPPEAHPFLSSHAWSYVPIALLSLVGIIWLVQRFHRRHSVMSSPSPVSSEASQSFAEKHYADDPEEAALDEEAYNILVAFCVDHVLPSCWTQIKFQESLLRKQCDTNQAAAFAISGLHNDSKFKTRGFWTNFWNLQSGLLESPGPTIKFDGMIECIFELEKEGYKNFCEQGMELAQPIDMNGDVLTEWNKWHHHHAEMVSAYNAIKRDVRFGKLHRLLPHRWGHFENLARPSD